MEFIITCGTSQIEKVEKNNFPLDLRKSGYENVKNNFFEMDISSNYDDAFNEAAQSPVDIISRQLVIILSDSCLSLRERIKNDINPLGAELSTFYLYLIEKELVGAGTHIFHILSSDTYAGLFNCLILKNVIKNMGWGSADIQIVKNLKRKPASCEGMHPLSSLSNKLTEILKNRQERYPKIIMSGGFKSVIPCLTAYSIIYALPLIYLFEDSPLVQELSPVQEISEETENRKLWERMRKSRAASNMLWYQQALDYRTSDEYVNWVD